jgi:radical SAM protein
VNLDQSPLLVFYETTRACPLACRHCRAEAMPDPLPGQLTTDQSKLFFEDLLRFGQRPPILILTGGDPLMRADIFELCAYASSIGITVALSPSVTPSLTTANVRRLKDVGVSSMSISLDGANAPTHENIRGVPGHFAQTVDAVLMLVDEGITVQINTTVMEINADELDTVAALIKELKAAIWEVFFLIGVGRGKGLSALDAAGNEDVCHFLYDASRYGFTVRTVEAPFFRRVASERRRGRPAPCGPLYRRLSHGLRERLGEPREAPRAGTAGTRDGKGIVFVSHAGDIYPAGFLPVSAGKVPTDSIVDVYRDHAVFASLRGGDFGGRCGRCDYREMCGGSRARAFSVAGDPLAEDPGCIYVPLVEDVVGAG